MTLRDDAGIPGEGLAEIAYPECHCGRGCQPYSAATRDVELRGPGGPVMAADVVDGEVVVGFGYQPPQSGSSDDARHDRLLTEGDTGCDRPPPRPVPASRPPGPGDERLPHDRLPQNTVVPAARRSPCLPAAVINLLADGSAPWAAVVQPVARTVRAAGHELWLAGGAVRELLSGHSREAVRDLDLTGTAPAGRFVELTRQALEEDGETYELWPKVSPDTLVCSVYGPRLSTPLLEYRGLGLNGFAFPTTGTDIAADSQNRDFTVNSILYDFERHLVIDPSERGLTDLAVSGRALVPASRSTDPVVRAELVLRAVKFLARWEADGPVDTRELCSWTAQFPADLVGELRDRGDQAWGELRGFHHECLGDVPADRQRALASDLGPCVTHLLETLLETRRTALP